MQERSHKSIALSWLGVFCLGLCCLWICGCSDNPEAKKAKQVRRDTVLAVQKSVEDGKYADAQESLESSLENNRPQGLTKDAALLASGNLHLANGRQMQADLNLKALPLRGSVDELDRLLRKSEQLLVEKERIEASLKSDQEEITELQQLLISDDPQSPSLPQQLEQQSAELEERVSKKTSLLKEREQIQSILDQYQADADVLQRQAEQTVGDKRLKLEKEAVEILLKRKEHYITVQEIENEISVLDSEIELIQTRVNGLTQAIEDVQNRIGQIENSPARQALSDQISQISKALNDNTKRMGAITGELQAGLRAYRQTVEQLCTVYEEAIKEFQKVQSSNAKLTAIASSASGYQYAGTACTIFVRAYHNLTDRLEGLIETADESYIPVLQEGLPTQSDLNTAYEQKAFQYFDKAIEAYQKAVESGVSRNEDMKCSLLKSQALVIHSKMKLADQLRQFDLANEAEAALDAVIQAGNELGDCFAQSEVMRVINSGGLDYLPLLPLNMEVFIDGKKQELSAWKNLRVEDQQAAVEENLKQIEQLTATYGQEMAGQLEPLKQEMLAAMESGFTGQTAGSGRPGDPNAPPPSPSFGEPNSM